MEIRSDRKTSDREIEVDPNRQVHPESLRGLAAFQSQGIENGSNSRLDALTARIIGEAIEVHKHLGSGLLESTYKSCLESELKDRGILVERQKPLLVHYRGLEVECGDRIDLLV